MPFPDLLDETIQPKIEGTLPEISISKALRNRILSMLKAKEKYAQVYEKTVVIRVNRSNNYVSFPIQWFHIAVICKRYAEALGEYCSFFDENIRDNVEMLEIFKNKEYSSTIISNLIPDEVDRQRFIDFVRGDNKFRPGKSLIDSTDARGRVEFFGTCVCNKLNVPLQSTTYLGYLVFYLYEQTDLYNDLEREVMDQVNNYLSSSVRDAAREIIKCIYAFDKCKTISSYFKVSTDTIKIDPSAMDLQFHSRAILDNVFNLPSSNVVNNSQRTFVNDPYYLNIEDKEYECYLSTQWQGNDYNTLDADGNYLKALVDVVNLYYSDYVKIVESDGTYIFEYKSSEFKTSSLPEAFRDDYSRRYITSLLAKPFVILTGNSGTGKTRIAKLFAEYMGVLDNGNDKNRLVVPVGADWTDNTKILGFYNPLEKKYVTTPVLDFILLAEKNPNIPFFLILDEMNLSHVERYYSDFLSAMESDEEIPLYKKDSSTIGGLDKNTIPESIRIPENLFVTGTVNIDETTYMFSPKVLDRANVIEFKPEEDEVINSFFALDQKTEIEPANQVVAEAFLRLAKEIRKGNCKITDGHKTIVTEVFRDIYGATSNYGYEFAFRTVKEISQYLSAAYELSDEWNDDSLYHSIDEQLLQKVLPKIHGNKKEIGDMLDNLENKCTQNGRVLTESKKKIKQMEDNLKSVHYASYI